MCVCIDPYICYMFLSIYDVYILSFLIIVFIQYYLRCRYINTFSLLLLFFGRLLKDMLRRHHFVVCSLSGSALIC